MAILTLPKKSLDKFYLKPKFLLASGVFIGFILIVAVIVYFLFSQNQQNSQAAKLNLPLDSSANQMYPGQIKEFSFKYANLGNDGEIQKAAIVVTVSDKLEIQKDSLVEKFGGEQNYYCINKDLVKSQNFSYTPRSSSTILNSPSCNGNIGGSNVALPPIVSASKENSDSWPTDKFGVLSFKVKVKNETQANQILDPGVTIEFSLNDTKSVFNKKVQIIVQPSLVNTCKANEYFENNACKPCPADSTSNAGSLSINQCVCPTEKIIINGNCTKPVNNLLELYPGQSGLVTLNYANTTKEALLKNAVLKINIGSELTIDASTLVDNYDSITNNRISSTLIQVNKDGSTTILYQPKSANSGDKESGTQTPADLNLPLDKSGNVSFKVRLKNDILNRNKISDILKPSLNNQGIKSSFEYNTNQSQILEIAFKVAANPSPLCSNLALNYPKCDRCGEDQSFVDNKCKVLAKSCLNGALDGPKCLECGANKYLSIFGCIDSVGAIAQVKGTLSKDKNDTLSLVTSPTSNFKILSPKDFYSQNLSFQILKLKKEKINQNNLQGSQKLVDNYLYDTTSFTPDNQVTKFLVPIDIQFQYNEDEIALFNEGNLKIQRWDGKSWSVLTGCTNDVNSNSIKCQSESVGLFALTANIK